MSASKDPFWIVVCDYREAVASNGTGVRAMRPAERPYRHGSEASALAEAMRLTRECRTQHFYVFKVVVGVRPPPDLVFEQFEGASDFNDEIPF